MKKQVITPLKKTETKNLFLVPVIVLSTAILFVLFFLGGPNHYSKLSFIQFWNIGHIIFFILSNYLIIKFLEKKGNMIVIMAVVIYTVVSGVLIELLQSKIGRSVDLNDLYRNSLGAGLAIAIFLPSLKNNNKILRRILLILLACFILLDQLSFYQALRYEIQAREDLPMLADFEKKPDIKQWSGDFLSQSQTHKTKGQYSMKVKLLSGKKYSGFTFEHFPSNWTAYQHLDFSLYNPDSAPLKLSVKITDYEHNINEVQNHNNRFNLKLKLEHGWNHISIPLIQIVQSPENRKMDISNISEITFFMYQLQKEAILYIDNLRLQ